jgi:hypothetical protein
LASCGPLRSKHPCRYSYGDLRHERNISGLRPVTSREQKDDAACTGARAAETGGALQDHQGNPMRVLRPRRIRAEGWPFSRRHSTFGYGLCAKSVLRARPVKFDRTGKTAKGSAAAAVVAEPKLREPLHNAGDSGCSRYNLPRTRQKPGMHPAATLLLTMPDGAPILQRSSRALSSVG